MGLSNFAVVRLLERVYVHVKISNLILPVQQHRGAGVTGSPETVMKREASEDLALFPQL
jgi:hypothetical protein